MKIISGKIKKPQKVIVYGTEGIGKSTFASHFPAPIFLDTEGSTKELDVDRFEKPLSWAEMGRLLKEFLNNRGEYKTLVVDTADWAEMLCVEHVCAKYQKKGIEEFGYGKGYTYVQEEFGKFLNFLESFIDAGMNVVITAHAKLCRVEQPEESGSYDKWGLKLSKGVAPLLKEWGDMVIFANYKTYVTKDENNKIKAKGGQRTMYTAHHVCWDAKNRHGLAQELPFDYKEIAHCIPSDMAELTDGVAKIQSAAQKEESLSSIIEEDPPAAVDVQEGIPQALLRLMEKNEVSERDIQVAVANNGYYPIDTPIAKYDPAFINGKIIAGWDKFYNAVLYYKSLPFSNEKQ